MGLPFGIQMLSGMMDLEKMKTTKRSRRGNIGRMIPNTIRYRKRKGARTIPPKKATLLRTILHAKNQRENALRANMNPTLSRNRNRLRRRRRNGKRTTPILKAPPVTTQAGRKERSKREKENFHRVGSRTRTRKLIFGRTASPSLQKAPKLDSMT